MRISAFSMLAVGLGLTGMQLAACSNSSDDCHATATCGGAASAPGAGSAGKSGSGADGGSDSAGSSNGGSTSGTSGNSGAGGENTGACKGDVSEDAACWTTNELGVFVSSESGDDGAGNGTKEAPFQTISKGIAAAAGKNVYVCLGAKNDTYTEQISIGAEQDGIKIYGGFDCADWTYSTTRKSLAKSPNAIGLRIEGLTAGVVIENLRIEASAGKNPGESSYGAFIVNSKKVTLRRVEITAGDGAKGADGEAGATGASGTKSTTDQDGEPALCDAALEDGKGGKPIAAVFGSKGGSGGGGVEDSKGGPGFDGTPSSNILEPDHMNGGPAAVGTEVGGDGTVGSDGKSGALGDPAAASGIFSASGFVPADGNDGANGFAAQGGGGGGASKGTTGCRGASGGAGGMGGDGGKLGKGGKGGGASVGLFSANSAITLTASSLSGAHGGDGGNGGSGGIPGQGANGGAGGDGVGTTIKAGGNGGKGGIGGGGGSGSGGTGGPSYGLVFDPTKPAFDPADTKVTPGKGGAAGLGGEVETVKAPDGSKGAAAPELEVK